MARSARLLAGAVLAGAAIAFAFTVVLLAALHAPSPHHLPVGVAAPADLTARISAGTEERAAGALDIRDVAYFGSHGVGSAITVLAGWAAAALVVIVATAPRTLRAARNGSDVLGPQELAEVRHRERDEAALG
jgi:hypothetical protein